MLAAAGLRGIDDVFAEIPPALRLDKALRLPPALASESELSRHMMDLMQRNRHTGDALSFLGAGCYPHHIPAVCSEINSRAEFLTAYAGEAYEDHGKWQALFEYTSLMADLLELDVVNVPTYDGFQASATALRMAGRVTGRPRVLLSEAVGRHKLATIRAYLDGALSVPGVAIEQIGDLAAAAGIPLHELSPQSGSLEEAFMQLTGQSAEFASHWDPSAPPPGGVADPYLAATANGGHTAPMTTAPVSTAPEGV